MLNELNESLQYLRNAGIPSPQIGIILGTGLGKAFVAQIENRQDISYSNIPHFPLSTVESHQGKLIFGKIRGKSVIVMQGRFHYYEGYTMQQVTFPVRVMKLLGVQHLLISNAAGSLSREFRKGELMLIDDHINLLPENPLRGKNHDSLGPRFPDMSQPYSTELNQRIRRIANAAGITLHEGVYVCVPGPNLETRAEYRYLQRIGGNAVGMSTVPEVIVANHMGLPCCAMSVLTDDCDPDNLKAVSLADIIAEAARAEPNLVRIFCDLIGDL